MLTLRFEENALQHSLHHFRPKTLDTVLLASSTSFLVSIKGWNWQAFLIA